MLLKKIGEIKKKVFSRVRLDKENEKLDFLSSQIVHINESVENNIVPSFALSLEELSNKANLSCELASQSKIKIDAALDKILSVLDIEGGKKAEISNIDFFTGKILEKEGGIKVVQIGANDGVSFNDTVYPIISKNPTVSSALLVEPLADLFQKLKMNYMGFPNIVLENLAIHESEKEMFIYRVSPGKAASLPEWVNGIASFNPKHHELSGTPSETIVKETVRCISFNELISKHKFEDFDFLQVDTEGYDYHILKAIDFKKLNPKIVRFEHSLSHNVMSIEQFNDIVKTFNDNGYQLIKDDFDAIAYKLEYF